jgi:hypothetical protein
MFALRAASFACNAFAAQIAAFCVCAVAGGRMLYLWWRMEEEGRRRVWSLYGWFCGLMVCGSCFGAVTWAARMMDRVNVFNAVDAFSRGDFVQLSGRCLHFPTVGPPCSS